MRGECFRDGWCATKRERRGREGRKRAAREFAKLVKSEVKSLRNVRPPAISALLLHGEGKVFWRRRCANKRERRGREGIKWK